MFLKMTENTKIQLENIPIILNLLQKTVILIEN